MLLLRSLLFHVAFYVNLAFWLVVWLPALVMPRHASMALGRVWGWTSLFLLDKIAGLKFEFRGVENIPQGAVIVACKHQSTWETFVLPIHFPDFSFILKHELVYIPFFGWYLKGAEQIGIDRAKGGKVLPEVVRKTRALFAQNRQLFIFPEGTRRPAGAPPEYKFGIAHIYRECDAPCVPAALNSGLFWPRRGLLIRPGTAVLEFLPPIAPGLDSKEFFRLIRDTIESASDRLMDEAVARDPSLAAIVARNRGVAPASA
jgi:1-acyl-sn-glycerol-3-phosphate acyltransferase